MCQNMKYQEKSKEILFHLMFPENFQISDCQEWEKKTVD